MHVVIAGCGWLGKAIGAHLVAEGHRVTAVRRSLSAHAELKSLGLQPLACDLSDPDAHRQLPEDTDAIVACAAAGGGGVAGYRQAYLAVNETLLRASQRLPVRALVYTSSTGVFGDMDGREVDESSAPSPTSATAQVLREAELLLQGAAAAGLPARIVRLSGLYGPGRWGTLQRVRSGTLALGTGDEAYMNFCHVDDAVGAVVAALWRGRDGAIYHGSDAGPARRREVVSWLAGQLGVEPYRVEAASAAGQLAAPNRRIAATWTRAQLGFTLCHPDFKSGFGQGIAELA